MRSNVLYLALAVVVLALFAVQPPAVAADTADAPRISKEDAKALLNSPKTVFVDGRITSAWEGSDKKIPGAVRADRWDFEGWAEGYARDTTFIVY